MREMIVHIDAAKRVINHQDLKDFFRSFKTGATLITARDYRKRSNQQNRYYWAVMVPIVRAGLQDLGFDDIEDNEDAHELLKELHLKKSILSRVTGDEIPIAGSTRKLTIFEMNEYIERVARWAAEYLGVFIPSPTQQYAELAEYTDHQEKLAEDGITTQESNNSGTGTSNTGETSEPLE